jgi:lipopolysaccharide transport system ATP-binding protein
MRDDIAIACDEVSKRYRLYGSPLEQAIDVLSPEWLRRRRSDVREFTALDGVSLEIRRGERVGLIGRNGAGKTTLLKLMTGNFAPTSGTVTVDGVVQALMQTGLGIHPDFTGHDNIRAALVYNGLEGPALEAALEDVVGFVELGEFLHQPMKTYSQGMRARLEFAAATAVKPDILIVDEVLGAGDAYFSIKSAERMTRLTRSGCALLLVSHSMQQVLQFCERAIWLEAGRINADGDALDVVKAYERASHERTVARRLGEARASAAAPVPAIADDGPSRWAEPGSPLRISAVRTLDASKQTATSFDPGAPFRVLIEVEALRSGVFPCRFAVLVFAGSGVQVCRFLSGKYDFELRAGERRSTLVQCDELLLNPGRYLLSVAAFEDYNVRDRAASKRYDLHSRSFEFEVADDFNGDPALVRHPAEWVSPWTA